MQRAAPVLAALVLAAPASALFASDEERVFALGGLVGGLFSLVVVLCAVSLFARRRGR